MGDTVYSRITMWSVFIGINAFCKSEKGHPRYSGSLFHGQSVVSFGHPQTNVFGFPSSVITPWRDGGRARYQPSAFSAAESGTKEIKTKGLVDPTVTRLKAPSR